MTFVLSLRYEKIDNYFYRYSHGALFLGIVAVATVVY